MYLDDVISNDHPSSISSNVPQLNELLIKSLLYFVRVFNTKQAC